MKNVYTVAVGALIVVAIVVYLVLRRLLYVWITGGV